MNKIQVVVGGQYGSEAKGHVAGMLAQREREAGQEVTVIRVAGPNAGHSARGVLDGEIWPLRQIPVAAVTEPSCRLVIGAGSEIDPQVLESEIEALDAAGYDVSGRLWIDQQATVITEENRRAEGGNDGPLQSRIGSTGKGIGAARADRIWRKAPLVKDRPIQLVGAGDPGYYANCDTAAQIRRWMAQGGQTVMIEGTQGYGLGLHAGHYPFCTSSDCRAIDFLAMAGISPWEQFGSQYGGTPEFEVWVVLRTFPIRVAGNSGSMLNEMTWEQLGEMTNGYIQPERTTVTKKVRRVGGWDADLAKAAVQANGGAPVVRAALMFADYWYPDLAGARGWSRVEEPSKAEIELQNDLEMVEEQIGCKIGYVGTGPASGIWTGRA